MRQNYHIGVDIGSTTVKFVVLDENKQIIYKSYLRHLSDPAAVLLQEIQKILGIVGSSKFSLIFTGSAGFGFAERMGVPHVQEVIACRAALRSLLPEAETAVELGGEDAKITWLGSSPEQRMNGVCAGGTGAFIDHMASLLGTDAAGLGSMAQRSRRIYPIASRCGVFAKTDVQALINDGASKEDIAGSVLQAVVNQTIGNLSQGRSIKGKVAFLGGPLHFLPQLRKQFIATLKLAEGEALIAQDADCFVAVGAALSSADNSLFDAAKLQQALQKLHDVPLDAIEKLPPLFKDAAEYEAFQKRHARNRVEQGRLCEYRGKCYLGIDAGSTTLKMALIADDGKLLWSYYSSNHGNPVQVAASALIELYKQMPQEAVIAGAGVTGYGEEMMKVAFGADFGEVETVAHLRSAQFFAPDVSFLMDIGGQDIKCFFVKNGIPDRLMLNEACSAGCGSFIENFAQGLGLDAAAFSKLALTAAEPVDLGVRCTVFMNSKVKQAQKDDAAIGDIAAGLAVSVVKNALYKVIRLRDTDELGETIVVQGGTFHSDAILRSMEQLTGKEVIRPDIAGLMGAFGAALLACDRCSHNEKSNLADAAALAAFAYHSKNYRCGGCGNNCLVTAHNFPAGVFHTGNRCPRGAGLPITNTGAPNMYAYKYQRVFDYQPLPPAAAKRGVIGIPRTLNMYEDYPFWFTLFTQLGYRVELSAPSTKAMYEEAMASIPSDSLCYPAKLVHGHIHNLLAQGIKKIFYPCIPYNEKECENANNCYNCPVVAGYAESAYANMEELRAGDVQFIHPFLPLYNDKRLAERLEEVLGSEGIKQKEITASISVARSEQHKFKQDVREMGRRLLNQVRQEQGHAVVLAGRPYHIDPEINHGLPEMIASFGLTVISEDVVAEMPQELQAQLPVVVDQWSWHSRLYRAAEFVADNPQLEFIQLSSFGCGLDAITSDVVKEILERHHRLYTLLKVDEINHISSARIRIRSLLAAMLQRLDKKHEETVPAYVPPAFSKKMRDNHVILAPQLSPVHFQFMETALRNAGYDLEIAPLPDREAVSLGLKYVNNDICYPAILVIGQMLRALTSGQYDQQKTSIALFQSGGACRATNYIALMRRALRDAGLGHVPVFSLYGEKSEGFTMSWHLLKDMVKGLLYGDLLMQLLHKVRPYETEKGAAESLYREMSQLCKESLSGLTDLTFQQTLEQVVAAFDELPLHENVRKPKIGIVGEILVKYHPVANNNIVSYLEAEGAEAVLPNMMDFFLYAAYDEQVKRRLLDGTWSNAVKSKLFMKFLDYYRKPLNKALQKSKRFKAYPPLSDLVKLAEKHLSTGNMAGEGWLLTAEMAKLLRSGVENIVCLQPFACLPNHITGKGMIRELLRSNPKANIIALDCDADTSQVNQMNRIKLMLEIAKEKLAENTPANEQKQPVNA